MATLDGVEPELRRRVTGMIAASGNRFWVSSAFRDPSAQLALYDRWVKALQKYGSREKAMASGATPANPPGKSKHGRKPCEAVDVACFAADNKLRDDLAKRFGLAQPVRDEKWHMELAPDRGPIPGSQPKEDRMESKYITVPCPTGGFWVVKRSDGGVAQYGGAPFHGAMPGKARVVAPLVGLTPCVQDGKVIGYWCYDADGHTYAFGAAPHYKGYAEHPEWRSPNRPIIGLVQTGGWRSGEQIRYAQIGEEQGDKDFEVDLYDLPAE